MEIKPTCANTPLALKKFIQDRPLRGGLNWQLIGVGLGMSEKEASASCGSKAYALLPQLSQLSFAQQ